MKRVNSTASALNSGMAKVDLGDNLTTEIPIGKRYYVVEETAGRTVKVWDYLNNREQMIYGDTGSRRITAHAGVSAGNWDIRRQGGTVFFNVAAGVLVGSGNPVLSGIIPPGFRPAGYRPFATTPYWASEVVRKGRCTGPDLQFMSIGAGDIMNISATWDTSDPWPTSLPGVAT